MMARFSNTGKYFALGVNDYAVVDFLCTNNGEPTAVIKYDKRVTVFFKEGDYSKCKCIFGLEDQIVELALRH